MAEVARRLLAAAVAVVASAGSLGAQPSHEQAAARTTIPRVFVGNAIAGGVVASTHALIARRNPFKAFAVGALGGAIHGFGKVIGAGMDSVGLVTNSIGAVGASVVNNAGRGTRVIEELFIPFGPLRMRLYPYSDDVVRFTVNVHELVALAEVYVTEGRHFDRRGSIGAGTFVFNASTSLEGPTGQASGLTNSSTITLATNAPLPERTFRHEVAHVQQHWFMVETIDRPIETALRSRIPLVRRIPSWIEFGVISTILYHWDNRLNDGNGPLRRLRELEAETLEGSENQGAVGIPGTFTARRP